MLLEKKIQGLRIALLGYAPVIDPGRLGETVARNRGLQVRATSDEAEAFAWLGVDDEERGKGNES